MRCEWTASEKLMLIRTLYVEHATIIVAVICSLIVAGLLKGTIGVTDLRNLRR
jgi:hypothetical protein